MLYKIKTGHGVSQLPMSQIVLLVSSLPRLQELSVSFIYTDRHAYLATASYKSDLTELGCIDWKFM